MVNVNAPLPFNLSNNHNHSQPSRLRTRSRQPSPDTERQSIVSSASASASASHELDEDLRWPTLNVRIVRGGSALARGRPITRDTIAHAHELRTEGEESGAAPVPAPAPVAAAGTAEVQSGMVCIDSLHLLFLGLLLMARIYYRRGMITPVRPLIGRYPAPRLKSKTLDRSPGVGVTESIFIGIMHYMEHECMSNPKAFAHVFFF